MFNSFLKNIMSLGIYWQFQVVSLANSEARQEFQSMEILPKMSKLVNN